MKLRVGYIQCQEQPADGSLDYTLTRVMNCDTVQNGGGSYDTLYYTNGGGSPDPVLNPVDPIVNDTPPPPPPPLPADQPAETMTLTTDAAPSTVTPEVTATAEGSDVNPWLIGGGLLLLFLLFGKNKKKR